MNELVLASKQIGYSKCDVYLDLLGSSSRYNVTSKWAFRRTWNKNFEKCSKYFFGFCLIFLHFINIYSNYSYFRSVGLSYFSKLFKNYWIFLRKYNILSIPKRNFIFKYMIDHHCTRICGYYRYVDENKKIHYHKKNKLFLLKLQFQ